MHFFFLSSKQLEVIVLNALIWWFFFSLYSVATLSLNRFYVASMFRVYRKRTADTLRSLEMHEKLCKKYCDRAVVVQHIHTNTVLSQYSSFLLSRILYMCVCV